MEGDEGNSDVVEGRGGADWRGSYVMVWGGHDGIDGVEDNGGFPLEEDIFCSEEGLEVIRDEWEVEGGCG